MTGAGKPARFPGSAWGAVFVLAASVLWGTTGTAATFAPDVSPLAIGAAAMGLGGLLQAGIAAGPMRAFRADLRSQWPILALGTLAVALYPLAFYSSMHLAGVAVGTVVSIGSAPLASAIIERVVDRRPLTGRWTAGALLGVGGAVLLCLAGAGNADGGLRPAASTSSAPAGIALGLLAGLTYALYSWAAHRLINAGVPSRAVMGSVFGVGGLLLMPVLLVTGTPLIASWQNFAVGAYMALVPMFAGYVLFGWGLARVRASTATTLSLAETVVAAVLAVVVVGERLPEHGWVGAAMIAASLFVLTVPIPRKRTTAVAAADAAGTEAQGTEAESSLIPR
ncbi:DMT family transporter [Pseudarthrobacter sulfonivorans]|uniref:DMT family transporter n=1 Tax=Pseudarthrobacter sulfonivorans TaxID=121292 RepID=UPI002106BF71|nr:DMT family transporter [Pseudarthrobacter sulfonivorans]